ncbi:SDR family NAD(P)-dependent oxidoreductase [Glutamicibacter sp. NPDC087344]|uniref:SDR family NAD(P)-dependent oxidoreductase n=1 Tax=Glutamicibacter sp. NPDC087344 TaxID=3363994 RepID=UPI0037FCFF47
MSADSAVLKLPQRVVITGGATGIGLACARLFANQGSHVGLISRSHTRLQQAATRLRGENDSLSVATAAADVADDAQTREAIAALADHLGGIDALVLCAGIEGEMGASIAEVTAAGFREVLEVNVLGTFNAVQSALPFLQKSTAGTVTVIGSDSGFVAVPGMLAYNASKGAAVQLVRALAVELYDDYGIRVNSVAPSIVDTPMARRGLGDAVMDHPDFPLQQPGDVAWSVAYLSSAQARAVNGQTLLSDFGYTGRSSFPA